MPRHSELPDELGNEPFLVRRAAALGVSKRRLDGRDLAAPYRGLRSRDEAPTTALERARVYVTRMPPTHVFSHVTAALVHGFPLPYRLERAIQVHVTVPVGKRPPQMIGVTGHELATTLDNIEILDGFPVTTPLQTWIDLAGLLRLGELVAVADFLCAGRSPRYTPADLQLAADAQRGRRGCRALREAAALARAAVDSPKESETRLFIVDAGLPEPIVNYEIFDTNGNFVARVDLSWPQYRVCVDYEGDGHRTSRPRFRADITRRERIEDQQWRLVRITDDDLANNGRDLIARLVSALRARGWRGAEP